MNFVSFVPRRGHVIMHIFPKSKEYDDQFDEAGIEMLAYDAQFREYRVHVDSEFVGSQRELILAVIRKSRESFRK